MKIIELKNGEKINVRSELNELTYLEGELFKQYFAKILYNINQQNFDDFYHDILETLNAQRFAEAVLQLHNYSQGLQMQDISGDGYAICFSILVEKEKPEINETKLFELFKKIDEVGINEPDLKASVVDFSEAFPTLRHLHKVRSERLTISDLTALLS